MVDGAAYLGSFLLASRKIGLWTSKIVAVVTTTHFTGCLFTGEKGDNMLDTGAPFYDTYACSNYES